MCGIKSKIFVLICFVSCSLFLFTKSAFANANTNNSSFTINSTSIPADGTTTATISIAVRDDSNNAVSGDTVTLTSSSDSGLVISGGGTGADSATATTDSNGNVNFTISSNNPNPVTDTFTAADTSNNPAVPLGSNSNVTVNFVAPGSCTASAPAAPQLTSAVASANNQITLTWTDSTDPVSYYLVSYGNVSGQYIYGNPNVGGQGTTTYTVNSLATATTYYFVVRAVNSCAPSSASNEVSAQTLGAVIAATPTPISADTANNLSNEEQPTPSDTPISTPTPTIQPTTTPTPAPTLIAGTSKTQLLIYLIIFILVIGGIGWFIYWKYEKNKQLPRRTPENNQPTEDLFKNRQPPTSF
jgi:hypothetical protein